jgi:hypothetical protein
LFAPSLFRPFVKLRERGVVFALTHLTNASQAIEVVEHSLDPLVYRLVGHAITVPSAITASTIT